MRESIIFGKLASVYPIRVNMKCGDHSSAPVSSIVECVKLILFVSSSNSYDIRTYALKFCISSRL